MAQRIGGCNCRLARHRRETRDENVKISVMELAFTLPLFVLFAFQSAVSLSLLLPRAISKHVASLLKQTRTNTIVRTVLYTILVALVAITITCFYDITETFKELQRNDSSQRAILQNVDLHRGQVGLLLGSANILLLFINPALAVEQQKCDSSKTNLEVLLKQFKNIQAEYDRVTSKPADKAGGAAADVYGEDSVLKRQIDSLIREKQALQAKVDEAFAAKTTADKRVDALVTQARGLEKEYDRLLSEKDDLERRLARFDANVGDRNKKSI